MDKRAWRQMESNYTPFWKSHSINVPLPIPGEINRRATLHCERHDQVNLIADTRRLFPSDVSGMENKSQQSTDRHSPVVVAFSQAVTCCSCRSSSLQDAHF